LMLFQEQCTLQIAQMNQVHRGVRQGFIGTSVCLSRVFIIMQNSTACWGLQKLEEILTDRKAGD
jgi:hypothetical protein